MPGQLPPAGSPSPPGHSSRGSSESKDASGDAGPSPRQVGRERVSWPCRVPCGCSPLVPRDLNSTFRCPRPSGSSREGLASRPPQPAFLGPLPRRECVQASVLVDTSLYLVPCLNDCGPYGQCLLLRRHGYLYAGCSCRAGRDGPDAPVPMDPSPGPLAGSHPSSAKVGGRPEEWGPLPPSLACRAPRPLCGLTETPPEMALLSGLGFPAHTCPQWPPFVHTCPDPLWGDEGFPPQGPGHGVGPEVPEQPLPGLAPPAQPWHPQCRVGPQAGVDGAAQTTAQPRLWPSRR